MRLNLICESVIDTDDGNILYKFMDEDQPTVKRVPGYTSPMSHFAEIWGYDVDGQQFMSHDHDEDGNFNLYKVIDYTAQDLFNITDYFEGYTVGWFGRPFKNVPEDVIRQMLQFSDDGGEDPELEDKFGYDLGDLMRSIKPGVWSEIYQEGIINVPATMQLVTLPRRLVCGISTGEPRFVDSRDACDDVRSVFMI